MNISKNTKKSKHGQKNWRKNIDTTEAEKQNAVLEKEILQKKTISVMKDEALFTYDTSNIICLTIRS